MALKGIKVPRKKPRAKVNRKTGFADPDWTGAEKWSGHKFHNERTKFAKLYYQNVKTADLKGYLFQYMKENKYSAQDIKAAKAAQHIPTQAGLYAKLLMTGMPDLQEKHAEFWSKKAGVTGDMRPVSEYVKEQIELAIENGKERVDTVVEVEETKATPPKPSIQEVMRNAAAVMARDIDDVVEDFVDTLDVKIIKKFEPYAMLKKAEAKANHARIIKTFYEENYAELVMVSDMPKGAALKKLSDEVKEEYAQLKEAYAHFNAKQLTAAVELYRKIIDACDMIITEQKATKKPRKVKQKSADQLVSKLKYNKADQTYGIASVAPTGLIGAVAAVVFNCKNRKLGIYVAKDADGFSVKGTTLQNFNEETSTQKTLRKPADILKEYKGRCSKPKALRVYGEITTTETKLTGRFSSDIVILAVFK